MTDDQNSPAVGARLERGVGPAVAEAPQWWHCDTHGPCKLTAWGCPHCVREMRQEIATLQEALLSAQETNLRLAPRALLPSARERVEAAERERCAAVARRWGETHDAATTVNARNAADKIARGIEGPNVRVEAGPTAAQE